MAETSLIGLINEDISYLQTLIQNQKNEPYFYFRVKLITNKNNSLTLVDKVVGISKNTLYIFWAEQQPPNKLGSSSTSLNNKQPINFQLLESPQQKIALSKFDEFTLIPNSDPQFEHYLKSIIPSFTPEKYPKICKQFSLLFMKSLKQYETQCILCPTYTKGLEMLYLLELMKSLNSYENELQKSSSSTARKSFLLQKGNLRLMRMICNLKFGFLEVDPQNFGYKFNSTYGQIEEKREMLIYENSLTDVMNKNCHQFFNPLTAKLYFKIIDEDSRKYALNFLLPIKEKIENLQLSGCEINQQNFQALFKDIVENNSKPSPFQSINEKHQIFPTLKHLNLSGNKFTDEIFPLFNKIIKNKQQKSQNSKQPLFQVLTSINLSRNSITLQSQKSHDEFVCFLSNLSSYVLKMDLSFNKIKSLEFFEKHFVLSDTKAGASALPVEYFNLVGNSSINISSKQSFINLYIDRQVQMKEKFMTEMGFIINLGQIGGSKNKNILKYLLLLENYLESQKDHIFFQQKTSFGTHFIQLASGFQFNQKTNQAHKKNSSIQSIDEINQKKKKLTVVLSKCLDQQQQRSLHMNPSVQSLRNSIVISPRNQKRSEVQAQILEEFSKAFYLKDYKMLSFLKNELVKNQKIPQKDLEKTFSLQFTKKRQQERLIIDMIEKVMNFIDFGGKDSLKNSDQEHQINKRLDKVVGLIRRKGLQGHGSQSMVYIKYLRDKMIENYLLNENSFGLVNPIYDLLKRMKKNCQYILQKNKTDQQEIVKVNYELLANLSQSQLVRQFLQNKQLTLDLMDQSLYDRLKYLLMDDVTAPKIIPLLPTIIKEIKLVATRTVRYYNQIVDPTIGINRKPLLLTKQRLTSRQFTSVSNKMQYLRLYSIMHYPFNKKLSPQISRSGYDGIMSCLNYNQHRQQQALEFIQVVNNFIVFLYYTPEIISEQTVTYINYIVNYMNELSVDTFQDLEWKQFIIEEFYLHLMSFKPEQKLSKGLLLLVFQYFTSRLICSYNIEKFILAYLIENEPTPVENSHLVLNNLKLSPSNLLNQQQKSLQHIENKEVKISWVIPNQFLIKSFLNQGKLTVYIRFDDNDLLKEHFVNKSQQNNQIQLLVHETTTIGEMIDMLLDPNNLYRQKIPLTQKDTVTKSVDNKKLRDCWLFEKINKQNKLQYFKPYQSYLYIGELAQQRFQHQDKIICYLRKTTINDRYHNKFVIDEEMEQIQLYEIFLRAVGNLSMGIELISKSPNNLLDRQFQKLNKGLNLQFTPNNLILLVFTHIVFILYSFKLTINKNNQDLQKEIEQKKEQDLQSVIGKLLDAKITDNSKKYKNNLIINCKTFTIEQKYLIKSNVKDLLTKSALRNLSMRQKICLFLDSVGDLAYCETLIDDEHIFILNNRFLLQGKLLYHTNQSNQIVNVYSKYNNLIIFNDLVDIKLNINQQDHHHQKEENLLKLSLKQLIFDDENKDITVKENFVEGSKLFIWYLYSHIVALCNNIIRFDTQLLDRIQQHGMGDTKNKQTQSKQQNNTTTTQKTKPFYHIPEQFIDFTQTRNKQNQSYERISQIQSQVTIKKQVQMDKIEKIQQPKNQQEIENSNSMKKKQQQQQQVYSRKSSRKSINRKSTNTIQPHQQQNGINKKHQKYNDESSLIPSRQSIYLEKRPNSGEEVKIINQKKTQFIEKVAKQNGDIRTEEIVKQIINIDKQSVKSIQQNKISNDTSEVITNQQRKSRREMPKRRSSRQKDK